MPSKKANAKRPLGGGGGGAAGGGADGKKDTLVQGENPLSYILLRNLRVQHPTQIPPLSLPAMLHTWARANRRVENEAQYEPCLRLERPHVPANKDTKGTRRGGR